jgi:hypothetical protein
MHKEYTYPTDYVVEYVNNREFRRCLRHIFQMNPSNYLDVIEDADDEFRDEMEYDETKNAIVFNTIMEATKDDPRFLDLYKKSAKLVFSVDVDIGLTLLTSYDYLRHFHPLLVLHIRNKENPDPSIEASITENFGILYKMFSP